MNELKIGGVYRHYKQKDYRVLGKVRHSETLEELVLYECLYENPGGQIWVRPIALFLGDIEVGDYRGPRFRLLDSI